MGIRPALILVAASMTAGCTAAPASSQAASSTSQPATTFPTAPTPTTVLTTRSEQPSPAPPAGDMIRRREEVASPSQGPAGTTTRPSEGPARAAAPVEAPTVPEPAPAEEAPVVTSGPMGGSIRNVSSDDLGHSWREGCPVAPSDLRLVEVSHHGYDGAVHTGRLVVHVDWAERVAGVFRRLFDAGFPVERMETIDVYEGSDAASMAANNTSAFNCRAVAGTNRWSEHAYGRAVDINPLVNPYVRGEVVDPPGGAAYLDRDGGVPGLIVDGDVVVRSFAAIGWGWGGHWSSAKDYQHFSSTGR